jgi:hypothetical protein
LVTYQNYTKMYVQKNIKYNDRLLCKQQKIFRYLKNRKLFTGYHLNPEYPFKLVHFPWHIRISGKTCIPSLAYPIQHLLHQLNTLPVLGFQTAISYQRHYSTAWYKLSLLAFCPLYGEEMLSWSRDLSPLLDTFLYSLPCSHYPTLVSPKLSQMYPFHTLPFYFFKILFNIISHLSTGHLF